MTDNKLDMLMERVRSIADAIERTQDWTQPELHLELLQAVLSHARRLHTQPRDAVQTLALLRSCALSLSTVATPLMAKQLQALASSASTRTHLPDIATDERT